MKTSVISERFKSILTAATFSMATSYLLVLSECIIAGNMIGEEAVAAIALVAPVIPFLQFIGEMIAAGTFALISYAGGKGDEEEINRLYSQAMTLAVAVGFVLTLLFVVFRVQILSYWDVSADLMTYADAYYAGVMIRPIIAFVELFLMPLLLIEGQERRNLVASAVKVTAGIALEIILCNSLGLFGISLATTISLALALLIEASYLFTKDCPLKYKFYLNFSKLRQVFILSICVAIPELFLTLLPFVVTSYLIANFNESIIAIFAMINTIINLAVAIFYGLDDVIQSMGCLYLGEKNVYGIKKVMNLCIKAAIAECVLMAAILIIFAGKVALAFGINEPATFDLAVDAIRIYSIFLIALFVTMTYAFYYLYIERKFMSITLQFLLLFMFPVVCVYICGGIFGLNGVWLGLGLGILLEFPINLFMIHIISKNSDEKLKGLLLLEEDRMSRQVSYDILAAEQDVMNLVYKLEQDLSSWNLDSKTLHRIQFFIEELGLDAVERATNKAFNVEITITKEKDYIELIVRDNGELVDITNEDETPRSFRMYVVSQVASNMPYKSYILIGGENRTVLKI